MRGFRRLLITWLRTHPRSRRTEQSLNNREHNRQFRSRLRGALKSIRAAIDGNDLAGGENRAQADDLADRRMASKGVIHRNAAGRYKSRLSTRLAARS